MPKRTRFSNNRSMAPLDAWSEANSRASSVRTASIKGKRLTNTPVRGIVSVLKFPDERRTKGFNTQTTYTRGSAGVGGGIHEQRDAPQRVLPQAPVELRHAESAPEEAALEE